MKSLLSGPGGQLRDPESCMIDRRDGGCLVVLPPRTVWDRSDLSREELQQWSFLVAAAGRAMLDCLQQLAGGTVNYWEAGNWALNDAAEPSGPKTGVDHKQVHLLLIGRSRESTDSDWKWGEAPMFPRYESADQWMKGKEHLTVEECGAVARRTGEILVDVYEVKREVLLVRSDTPVE